MSRKVIRDIVMPIIQKILNAYGVFDSGHHIDLQDESLEGFLEEELQKRFGIIGKEGNCEQLEQLLVEAKKSNPVEFELIIEQLLQKYIKLRLTINKIRNKKKEGPPDRLKKMREKAKEVWRETV